MATEERLQKMKALIQAHYDAAVNDQNLDLLDQQLTPDFLDHGMPPGTPHGPAPVKAWCAQLKTIFPDLRVELNEAVAEGDRVAVRAIWTGTHTAEFLGLPPTGRKITFHGAVFWRLVEDRIAERWAVIDTDELLRQLKG